MRPIFTERVARSVGRSVCRSVCHTSEPCKNCCTDRDAVWVEDSGGPREPCIRWGPDPHGGVEVAGTAVKFGDFIKLLGVKFDPSISMNRHVTELVRSCNYHIRALRHIRPLLTLESTKIVALGIVAARLD